MFWSRKLNTNVGHGVALDDLKGAIRKINIADKNVILNQKVRTATPFYFQ